MPLETIPESVFYVNDRDMSYDKEDSGMPRNFIFPPAVFSQCLIKDEISEVRLSCKLSC